MDAESQSERIINICIRWIIANSEIAPEAPAISSFAAFARHLVPRAQKFAQHQPQNPSIFAPGCTQLHLIAEKRPKTKIFLPVAKTAKCVILSNLRRWFRAPRWIVRAV